jgi:hypothetical protein
MAATDLSDSIGRHEKEWVGRSLAGKVAKEV